MQTAFSQFLQLLLNYRFYCPHALYRITQVQSSFSLRRKSLTTSARNKIDTLLLQIISSYWIIRHYVTSLLPRTRALTVLLASIRSFGHKVQNLWYWSPSFLVSSVTVCDSCRDIPNRFFLVSESLVTISRLLSSSFSPAPLADSSSWPSNGANGLVRRARVLHCGCSRRTLHIRMQLHAASADRYSAAKSKASSA